MAVKTIFAAFASAKFIVVFVCGLASSSETSGKESEMWKPGPGTTWQWQLSEPPEGTLLDVDVYVVDGFDTSAAMVERIHANGSVAVCYINVGAWEDWRPDGGEFPEGVIGREYEGWPGEKWLDIRDIRALAPIMEARMDLCAAKGFDAVEPDNMDGYANETGFGLTASHQLRYNKWLAEKAHERGLSIAHKNNPGQAKPLQPYFDFAITEDCFDGGWCHEMSPFIENGKAVLAAEYTDTGAALPDFCPKAKKLGFDAILKKRDLGEWRRACQNG